MKHEKYESGHWKLTDDRLGVMINGNVRGTAYPYGEDAKPSDYAHALLFTSSKKLLETGGAFLKEVYKQFGQNVELWPSAIEFENAIAEALGLRDITNP